MTLNPVILVAKLGEKIVEALDRRIGTRMLDEDQPEPPEGLNIRGRIYPDDSSYRIVGPRGEQP